MKDAAFVTTEPGAEIQARKNMLFSGTTVAYGSANAIVTSTGARSEIGKIGVQVAATETAASPLKVKLDEFGELLTKVGTQDNLCIHPYIHLSIYLSICEMGKIGVQVAATETAASPLKVKLDEFGELLTKVCAYYLLYVSIHLSGCLSICLSVCLSIYLSIYISHRDGGVAAQSETGRVRRAAHKGIYMIFNICIHPFIYLSICLSVYLSIYLYRPPRRRRRR